MPWPHGPERSADQRRFGTLLTASELYQRTVKDTLAVIQTALEEGALVERELEYAQLVTALAEAERALAWVADRSRILPGEQEEGA